MSRNFSVIKKKERSKRKKSKVGCQGWQVWHWAFHWVIGGPMPGALVQFSVASSVRTQLPTLRQGFGFAQCQGIPFACAGVECEMYRCPEAKRMGHPRQTLLISVRQRVSWIGNPNSIFHISRNARYFDLPILRRLPFESSRDCR